MTKAATSPLVFGASVWKDDVKLYDASPVTVRGHPAPWLTE